MRVTTIKKKLREAGISQDELIIKSYEIEIQCGYAESDIGHCDRDRVDEMKKLIYKAIPEFNGGFYTGYDALVLKENYKNVEMGDWNDPSSKWHY